MLYYLSDYTEGAHPRILEQLQEKFVLMLKTRKNLLRKASA